MLFMQTNTWINLYNERSRTYRICGKKYTFKGVFLIWVSAGSGTHYLIHSEGRSIVLPKWDVIDIDADAFEYPQENQNEDVNTPIKGCPEHKIHFDSTCPCKTPPVVRVN